MRCLAMTTAPPKWGISKGRRHVYNRFDNDIPQGEDMALYKFGEHLTKSDDKAFDGRHSPGTAATYPGIYRCTACGDEIAIAGGHTLPPQNHRQHSPSSGAIQWQLLIYPVQKK